MVFSAIVDIFAITAVLAIISQVIQDKYVNKAEMKAQQEKMKETQKKMQELAKKDDPKSKNELEALEKEMLVAMQQMMSKSSKVMVWSFVIFIPAFAALGFLYGKEIISLPVPLPWLAGGFDLFKTGTWGIEIYKETNWFGWYFASYLAITIIINAAKRFWKSGVAAERKSGVVNG